MALTAAAATSNPTNDASVLTPDSYSVTPAKILYAPKVDLTSVVTQGIPNNAHLTLSFVVSTDGAAHNVKVVSSTDPALNGPVMVAVSKYHFRAATQGDQAVPYLVKLAVAVQR
jgi:hypothetical protein